MFRWQRHGGWPVSTFRMWFDEFVTSPEARTATLNVARRVGVSQLADDLAQEWWLAMTATLDRLDSRGAVMPDWLVDDDAARRYALRALNNRAVDLVRSIRPTVPLDVDLRDDASAPGSVPAPRSADGMAQPGGAQTRFTDPTATTERRLLCDQWALTILRRRDAGLIVHHGCRTDALVQMLLTIVEWVREDEPFAAPDVRGGSDEWDRLIYAALEATDPDRWRNGSASAALRQRKGRYGRAARHELALLVRDDGDGHPATTTMPVAVEDDRR